ncbi:MAG: RIP metalloprotease RseP [Flavobacteriales bacterium]|nr:RIP metalloprotease RseP [Flavobacteriales bacterium]|tara:strand:- start:12134 stop:13453 length:1320 start_codon:yes stop_codon:yes gene_type:complete
MSLFLIKGSQLLLSLSILIILHELGHFIPAKLFKTRVEKFYLFFDVKFSLFKKKIGETVYGIGWLPLGGYVKISGMIDESMDTEHLAKEPEPWEFRSKPAWQRLIIMLGGVTVNLLLGFLIYMMIAFIWGKTIITNDSLSGGYEVAEMMKPYGFKDGDKILEVDGKPLENILDISKFLFLRNVSNVKVEHYDGRKEILNIPESIGVQMFETGNLIPFTALVQPIIDSIEPNSPAERAGLISNDLILSVNGKSILKWQEFTKLVKESPKKIININIKRNNSILSKEISLRDNNTIGVSLKVPVITPTKLNFTILESITRGYNKAYWTLLDYISQFKYVFSKKGASQLGGFGAIGGLFPPTWDWEGFWESTALISIILAFMNLLPIPALDGGHVMFLLYEIASGRKPNDKFMEYAQIFGFFLLMSLVLFANGNDIYRAIFG